MKIGDKIRFIHSKGEGIIKKVIDDKTIEVEIEDGFRIPVLKNEVVVIAIEEAKRFSSGYSLEKETSSAPVKGGNNAVWMAFLPFNDKIYSLYIINETDRTILFNIGEKSTTTYEGIASGSLLKNTSEKLKEYKIADFENWPEFHTQVLFFKQGKSDYLPPLEKKIKFKAASFYKSKKYNNVLEKEAFVYPLDATGKMLNQDDLKQMLLTEEPGIQKAIIDSPHPEIDLHIEKINPQYKLLQSSEILQFQLNYFEKTLENAIASGMKEIIFIHGTGNGILKNNLHKKLSENIFIKYFEDARKEKFGYGATLVTIK